MTPIREVGLVEIVAAALQRNYPDISVDIVENLLDLGNAGAVLNAVLTGSGLRPRERSPGEAPAPGPDPGARLASGSSPTAAGGISTVSSPPAAATAIP